MLLFLVDVSQSDKPDFLLVERQTHLKPLSHTMIYFHKHACGHEWKLHFYACMYLFLDERNPF